MRTLTLAALIAAAALAPTTPAFAQKKAPKFKGIDAKTMAAYQKFCEFGFMRWRESGGLVHERVSDGAKSGIPAFSPSQPIDPKMRKRLPLKLPKMPPVSAPFGLDFYNSRPDEAELAKLAGLKTLIALNVQECKLTDEGLKPLEGLSNLEMLNLRTNKLITDGSLKTLVKFKKLTHLDLYKTGVSDDGIKELAKLERLVLLDLSWLQVTATTLKELAGLKALAGLRLGSMRLGEAELDELAGFPSLAYLGLADSQMKPGMLARLAACKGLERLDISRTGITDKELMELAACKGLKRVVVAETRVTAEGKAMLKMALPKVVFGYWD